MGNVSLRKQDIEYVEAARDGLIDTLRDILAHEEGEQRRPSSVDVVVRLGSRAHAKVTNALNEAARGGHVEVCRFLCNEGGCDPKKTLELGRVITPLHSAANVETAAVLLEAGAISRYRQTLRSDSRIPDPSWYHNSQRRSAVAGFIDAHNKRLDHAKQKRIAARKNLQLVWTSLNSCVVSIRFIRTIQARWKERFYCPDTGAFIQKGIGAKNFYGRTNVFAAGGATSAVRALRKTNNVLETVVPTTAQFIAEYLARVKEDVLGELDSLSQRTRTACNT